MDQRVELAIRCCSHSQCSVIKHQWMPGSSFKQIALTML